MDFVKVLSEHPGLWIVTIAGPAAMQLIGGMLLELFKIWFYKRKPKKADAEVSSVVAKRPVPPLLQRRHLILAALALLLTVAAILLAKTDTQFVVLYAVAVALVLLLIPEALSLVRGFHSARAETPRRRSRLRIRVTIQIGAALLAIVTSGVTLTQQAAGLYRELRQPPVSSVDVKTGSSDFMVMGDVEDIQFTHGSESDVFTYTPTPGGGSKHEWQYKYIDGVPNPNPAKFGGVMYVNDRFPGHPGTNQADGVDLTCCMSHLSWEARSDNQGATVNFVFGGVSWRWQGNQIADLPYPDTLPVRALGTYKLFENWRSFSFDLRSAGLHELDFKRVIGAFGWTISWPIPPEPGRKYTLEIRNVRYQR